MYKYYQLFHVCMSSVLLLRDQTKMVHVLMIMHQSFGAWQGYSWANMHIIVLLRCLIIWTALWENRSSGFPTRSDTNRAVQPQKMARGLKCYCAADLHLCFRICKNLVFSGRGSYYHSVKKVPVPSCYCTNIPLWGIFIKLNEIASLCKICYYPFIHWWTN